MRYLFAVIVVLVAGCEKEVPRYPDSYANKEAPNFAPPPAETSTPRPPIYATPNVPEPSDEKAGSGPKPGQTNNFMSPARPSNQ